MRRSAVFVLMSGIRGDVGAGGDKGWGGTEGKRSNDKMVKKI